MKRAFVRIRTVGYKEDNGGIIMQNIPVMEEGNRTQCSAIPTFLVKVVYAENFSIQGFIRWIEEGKTVPFRSYMEMQHLIEEGLYMCRKEMVRLRSWEMAGEKADNGSKKSKSSEVL
ncbi:MAG: hypothetical protein ACOX42_07215 [Clostridia bacterium]|nr:hypothetical protein [Clostridiales bacterium]